MNGNKKQPGDGVLEDPSQQLLLQVDELSATIEILYSELLSKHRLGGMLEENELLSLVMDDLTATFRGLVPTSRVVYLELSPDGKNLRVEWERNTLATALLQPGYSVKLDDLTKSELLDPDEPQLTGDLLGFLDQHPNVQFARLICTEGYRGALACPLIAGGHPFGYLIFASVDPYGIRKPHQQSIVPCLNRVARLIRRVRLYDQLVALDPPPATARPRRRHDDAPRRPYIHGQSKGKVIYADPSNVSQLIAEQGLTLAGYHVWTCGSARELINLFEEMGADVIIAAPEALQMDGKSLEEVLRQDYPIWLVPFVYVLPASLGNLANDHSSGVDTSMVLVKPLRIPSLLSRIEHALQVARELVAERETATEDASAEGLAHHPTDSRLIANRFRVVEAFSREVGPDLYIAEDTTTSGSDEVLIKECPVRGGDPGSVARASELLREAIHLRSLDHPAIVSIIDAGVADGAAYLALEYLHGITIREHIRHEGPLPEPEVILCALALGLALEHLQERELVHRDIRPSHVMLTAIGGVKLIGFGMSTPALDRLAQREHQLTTALYLPPEWCDKAPEWDIQSDLYAVGITLYYAATGSYPFDDADAEEMVRMHCEEEPEPLHQVNPEISEACSALVHSLLAKDPAERPAPRALWQEAMRLLHQDNPEWQSPLK